MVPPNADAPRRKRSRTSRRLGRMARMFLGNLLFPTLAAVLAYLLWTFWVYPWVARFLG